MNLKELALTIDNMSHAMARLSLSGEFGSIAGKRLGVCYNLTAIENNLQAAMRYQLPPVKFTDHLSDCFGWAKC